MPRTKTFLVVRRAIVLAVVLAISLAVVVAWLALRQSRERSPADDLAAGRCGDAVCQLAESSATCPRDCPRVEISAERWTQVNGPYGGYITDLEKAGDRLWAATSFTSRGSNGIYEIASGGLAWTALGGSRETIRDLALDAADPTNIGFVAAAPGGLSMTWDGGRTWHARDPGDLGVAAVTALAMSRADGSLLFAGARVDGRALLLASEDDGVSWTRKSSLPETEWSVRPIWAGVSDEQRNEIRVIAPHPVDPNLLFVGTNSALFKSVDRGKSWRRVDASFHRSDTMDIKFGTADPDQVYVRVGLFEEPTCMEVGGMEDRQRAEETERTRCAGVYKSTDLGETWQQLDAHYFDPSEGGIFLDDHDPDVAYAIFSRKILKTEDGGRTWTEFFWTHDQKRVPNVGLERLVVGADSDELFIAGRQGLWHTDDGGLRWHERNQGFIGTEVVDIVRAADGALYAGTYSLGMFKSTDRGMNWTFASYDLENPYVMLIGAHPTDPGTLFLTTNGGVYGSRDGALTWERLEGARSELLPGVAHLHGIAVDPADPQRIYVGGGGDQYTPRDWGGVSISEDGGRTWRQSNAGFPTDVHVSKIVIDRADPAVVYATTQGATNFREKTGTGFGVFRSTDRGETWTKINQGLETVEINTIALDPGDPDVLYLGTDDDGIYKSTDGGGSWEKLLIPQLPERYGVGDLVVDPRDSGTVYAATVDYFRLSEARGLVGDHGVYVSRDGGASWRPFNEGLEHAGAFGLELDAEAEILYVGTRGGGVYWRAVD